VKQRASKRHPAVVIRSYNHGRAVDIDKNKDDATQLKTSTTASTSTATTAVSDAVGTETDSSPSGITRWTRVSAMLIRPPYVIGQAIIFFTCDFFFHHLSLWPPCVADADIIFLPCGFFFYLLFPRLIPAVADWLSTILPRCGCLEGNRENYQVCSLQYCVQQLYTVNCTHDRHSDLRRMAFKQQLRRPVFCSCRTTSVEHVASTATAL